MGKISAPEPINPAHQLDNFDSGEIILDLWLKQRALNNDNSGASRTFVVHQNESVIAYYSLAMGSLSLQDAPGKIKRNMPNPIPVMILGRLAVDQRWHKHGLGKALLKDAVLRTFKVSHDVGIRALLVHTISDAAKHFYKRYGFIESPMEPMTLMLPMSDLASVIK